MRWRAALGLIVLVCSSSSCALLRQVQFERPTLELDSIELLALGLSGGSLRLWFNVYNPNTYDLRTTRVEATLELEETHFGDVQLSERIALPANEHTRVAVPFDFSWEGIGQGARALLERGSVQYSLDALLRIEAAGTGRNLNFRRTGEVPLQR